jgi:hypothetical protein
MKVTIDNDGIVHFTIEVEMSERWVSHFLAMLKTMQAYGNLGCSRTVAIYSDGDGDFRPKFSWPSALNDCAKPMSGWGEVEGDVKFDAG